MSFFTSTHTLSTETPLPAGINFDSALALLHDHPTFQNLQPLVTENKIIPAPAPTSWIAKESTTLCPASTTPEYRAVTIAVPMGPFGSSSVTTTSACIDTEEGLINVFEAPMGLYGTNRWSVKRSEEGDGLVFVEEARLTGFVALMPFVMMTKGKSHAELAAKFVEKLQGGI